MVFNKWSCEFENLYNPSFCDNDFDDTFYNTVLNEKDFLEDKMLDPLFEENIDLNRSITKQEVEKVVYSAKKGKSVGPDQIPYEVLKSPIIIDVLHAMFNMCFDTGILPSLWRKAIISPIPKTAKKDKRIPLCLTIGELV